LKYIEGSTKDVHFTSYGAFKQSLTGVLSFAQFILCRVNTVLYCNVSGRMVLLLLIKLID